jgi:anti-sigma regulatory factor (Ser/Thr protein kinase)
MKDKDKSAHHVTSGLRAFPGEARQVAHARQYIRHALGEDFPHLDDATLLVSELASNAVTYTKTAHNGRFEVTWHRRGNWALITVFDQGSETPPSPRTPDLDNLDDLENLEELGGRGLAIVDDLATWWGLVRNRNAGNLLWCEIGDPAHRPALPEQADYPATLAELFLQRSPTTPSPIPRNPLDS